MQDTLFQTLFLNYVFKSAYKVDGNPVYFLAFFIQFINAKLTQGPKSETYHYYFTMINESDRSA